jgi:putative endonuclease
MAKGLRILRRRYKTPVGEVDLIGLDRGVLVFIEVKGRQSLDEALYSLTPKMRVRITDAAGYFLSENPAYQNFDMRFDLVAVSLPFRIQHLDNAWMAQ